VSFVRGSIVGGQQYGATGEPGLDGVERRFGFTFGRLRTGGELRIVAIGSELGFGRHREKKGS